MDAITIIELPTSVAVEAAKAKFWRKNVVKLTRSELGKQIGYSDQTISFFERGYDSRGELLGDRSWKRYRLICTGLMASKGAWQW